MQQKRDTEDIKNTLVRTEMDRDGIYQNKIAKKILQSTLKVEIVTGY